VPCLDENTVLRFVGGGLDPATAEAVERHAAVCDECRFLLSSAGAAVLEEPSAAATVVQGPTAATAEATEPETPAFVRPGVVLGNTYRIERLIGRGGMGAVYAASHLRLHRRFAIKVIAEYLHPGANEIARLRREAEVTSRLAHPHIVEVVDFDYTEANTPFLVMELLEGESLSTRLHREGVIEGAAFASILRETTSALEAAHRHDVVHRDLKPTNIFLCQQGGRDDFVKVMDFGLSKILSARNELTGHSEVLGSPSYMAPEQARGESALVDHRADIFALGAIAFRMLTGAPPFDGDSVPSTLFNVVYRVPTTSPRWDAVPPPLREVILRALAKDRAARQPSMAVLWEELAAALTTGEASAIPLPLAPRSVAAGAPRRLGPRLVGALIGLGAAAAVGVALWAGHRPDGRSAAPRAPAVASPPAPRAVPPSPAANEPAVLAPASRPASASAASPPARSAASATPRPTPAALRHHQPGKLTVQSRAGRAGPYVWADVLLDGKPVGQTPLTLESVSAGAHRVEVRRAGYSADAQSIRVRPGGRAVVSFVLRARAR